MDRKSREQKRLTTATIVHMTAAEDDGETHVGVLSDASTEGIGCRKYADQQRSLEVGRRFDFVFVLPTGMVQGRGTIAWCDGDQFGVKFDELTPDGARRLREFGEAPW